MNRNYLKRIIEFLVYGVKPKNVRAEITVSTKEDSLKGQNVIITGGGRGLGFNIAEKCVANGAQILITGRNEETLINSSKKLGGCHYIPFNVTNFDGIHVFFDECERKFNGPVSCLVNNAGISLHEGSIENVSFENFDSQFDTNIKAPYFLSQEFIRRYKSYKLRKGNILFISSERGLYCDDQPYGLTKVAINSLVEALGRRYVNLGLRVNAVAPGVTVSDLTEFTKDGNLYRSSSCGERAYLGEEVAEIVAFILSDYSGCISSQIIPCNRGNHLKCDW